MENIGANIRLRRLELGMSQEELAKKAGYNSRSTINKIEKDGRNLPSKKIIEIAKALRTTPAFIMGWEDSHGNDLTSESNIVMDLYNQLDPDDQAEMVDIMKLKLSRKKDATASATKSA